MRTLRQLSGRHTARPWSGGGWLLAALLVLLTAPSVATAASLQAQHGWVSARVSYQRARFGEAKDVRLTITRKGTAVLRTAIRSKSTCGSSCLPVGLKVADLEGTGEPDVVLSLYSGGAHCCFIDQVFHFDARRKAYRKSERNFGDPGARLERLGGRYVFVTADEQFAYLYSSFAASGLPLQILSFSGGSFHDVTRRYPARIRADAASWWSIFRHYAGDRSAETEGIFAAWAADEYRLGHTTAVSRALSTAVRQGQLRGQLGPRAYARALPRFLRRHGYRP